MSKKKHKKEAVFREIMGTRRRFEKLELSGTKKRGTEAKGRKTGTDVKKEE